MAGTVADCTQALTLIDGLDGEAVLAGRGYDTDEIVGSIQKKGMEVVIPPKCNLKEQCAYDKYPYKLRHLIENAFLKMKEWRGVATRYAKRLSSYLAIVQIRCAFMWFKEIS